MSTSPDLRAVYPTAVVQAAAVGMPAPVLLLQAPESQSFGGVVAVVVLVAVVHWGCGRFLRSRGVPGPWGPPTAVTTAVLAGTPVVLSAWSRVDSLPFLLPVLLFLLCPLVALVGVAVLRSGRRLPSALGAVLAVNALVAGSLWWVSEAELNREREEVEREVAAFPLPIAVLDSPDWEPVQIEVSDDRDTAWIYYAPVEPGPEPAGFRLVMVTERSADPGGRSPLFEGCEQENGRRFCEEHGEAVFTWEEDVHGDPEWEELRIPFAAGATATLRTAVPTAKDGETLIPFPDVGMVHLVDRVRPAEPGEVEESALTL
ncbi:hypothetical protein [Nocardiopsis sp. CC223A]|uniref:hypothetical protein n=1 Tax=Nocardiopsis sp. CC223A TaxID=3044051 RepID=UPI00278BE253|nr:hypothetical protein [Nocardiopsis sp. CC223A]